MAKAEGLPVNEKHRAGAAPSPSNTARTLSNESRKPVTSRGGRLALLTEIAREQGDMVRLREGWLFCHPDAVRDILVTNDRRLRKSPVLRWVKFTLGNGLLTSEGDLHQRQRRLIQPSLHPSRLAGYAEVMTRHAAESCAQWKDGEVVFLHREMLRLTLRIVAEALFGAAVGPEVDVISEAMDRNVAMFRRVASPWGPLLAALPTPFNIRFLLARRKLVGTLRRFIAARRATGEVRDDLLSRLLQAQDPDGDGGMSEKQLVDECVTLFAAGHETTANALTYALWLLSQNPEAEQRLHAEVDRVLATRNVPAIDDLEKLTYTRMVMAESMRLYPPAWIVGRQVAEPCEIGGWLAPAGTVVMVSQWVTHRDSRWWPEPERFIPERFAPEADARHRWAYFPFGGGSRICVGEAFAWAESTLVLASIVRAWRMEAADAEPIDVEPGITLRPKSDVRMKLHRRGN